jgi:predicted RNase H-like nuclease (RuvC/YqgF family)
MDCVKDLACPKCMKKTNVLTDLIEEDAIIHGGKVHVEQIPMKLCVSCAMRSASWYKSRCQPPINLSDKRDDMHRVLERTVDDHFHHKQHILNEMNLLKSQFALLVAKFQESESKTESLTQLVKDQQVTPLTQEVSTLTQLVKDQQVTPLTQEVSTLTHKVTSLTDQVTSLTHKVTTLTDELNVSKDNAKKQTVADGLRYANFLVGIKSGNEPC